MDLATLRAAQPDQLQRAAQDWDAAASRLEKLSADFRTQTGTLFEGSWAGAAADAARASLSGMSARLTATNGDMAAMAALYRDAAMGVCDAQALLRTAEDLAASNGLVIGASGEVSLAAPALGGHGGLPAAYLLGFSAAGIGKAIVAFGDPDTAATTVTYVPGVGTTLTGALSNSQRAANLWRQAHRGDPGQSLSSVFWLDYNAPRRGLSLAGLMADRQIGSVADAVAGAKSLAGFQAGLAAAHVAGVPDRTVLLGHSYGSLVVGEAAAHDGVRPGDSIFVDSPGVGVNHAAQLGVPASHVWAGANVNDPIPDMPHAETLLPGERRTARWARP